MTKCGSRLFCLQRRLQLCQWVSSTCLSVPASWIPLNYLETEKNLHLSLRLLCLQSAANKNHHCQCKQMHGNYVRITTALCHLTAVQRQTMCLNCSMKAFPATSWPTLEMKSGTWPSRLRQSAMLRPTPPYDWRTVPLYVKLCNWYKSLVKSSTFRLSKITKQFKCIN